MSIGVLYWCGQNENATVEVAAGYLGRLCLWYISLKLFFFIVGANVQIPQVFYGRRFPPFLLIRIKAVIKINKNGRTRPPFQ